MIKADMRQAMAELKTNSWIYNNPDYIHEKTRIVAPRLGLCIRNESDQIPRTAIAGRNRILQNGAWIKCDKDRIVVVVRVVVVVVVVVLIVTVVVTVVVVAE
ncbi:hypothetical protein ElyMa_005960500 [Elysia marginata]|uniref:Uncharacterized protein n=1 Tax=Elysia marginata TaxID=1093978 RepID=A0AAV4GBY0_9GAST|nr:hypothetical protein ElyMa_005960500 [Elysia marginata]